MLGLRTVKSVIRTVVTRAIKSLQSMRLALNLNGVNTFGRFLLREINPEGDIDVEFETGPIIPPIGTAFCIVDQSITNNFTLKEFYLQVTAGGQLQMVLGGNFMITNINSPPLEPNTTYRASLSGTTLRYFRNGVQNQMVTVSRGTAREPSAPTKIGAWGSNAAFGGFYRGHIKWIRINGVLWPLNERDHINQLPKSSAVESLQAKAYNACSTGLLPLTVDDDGYSVITLNGLQTWSYAAFNIPVVPGMTYVIETIADFQGSNIFYSTTNDTASGAVELRNVQNTPANKVSRQVITAHPSLARPFMLITRNGQNAMTGTYRHKFLRAFPIGIPTGPELVANGNFDTDASGWFTNGGGQIAWSSGRAVLSLQAGIQSRMERSIVLEPGELYIATADIITFSGTTIARLNILRGMPGNYAGIQNAQVNIIQNKIVNIFRAPAADALVQIVGDSTNAGSITVDNVSVRKLKDVYNPIALNNVVPEQWQEIPA